MSLCGSGCASIVSPATMDAIDEHFLALLESTPDLICVKDSDRVWLRASRSFETLFGRPLNEIIGMKDELLFPSEVVAHAIDDDRRILATGEPVVDKIEGGEIAPGVERWVSTTKIPWRADDGRILGLISISRDITKSKGAIDRLRDEVEELRRMQLARQILSGIAHDFNNLLTVILGATSVLGDVDGEHTSVIESITSAASKAQLLSRQLLEFDAADRRGAEPCVLSTCVEQACQLVRRAAPAAVDFRVKVDASAVKVILAQSQVQQIVFNLALNAFDATDGPGTVTVSSRCEVVDGQAWGVIEVTDTGRGLTVDERAHMFEPFYSSRRSGPGVGIGLSTLKAMVDSTTPRGWIDVVSKVGQGSRFTVFVPQTEEAPSTPASAGEGSRRLEAGVLVLEDQAPIRELIRRMLERHSCLVFEASTFDEARTLIEDQPGAIDVLLTDVVLTQDNGVRAARALCALQPSLKVVYMSGYAESTFRRFQLPREDVILVPKPFTISELTAAVSQALGQGAEASS